MDSKKIKSDILRSIKDVFHVENFELLTEILHLNNDEINIEKIYIVIEIGKKLSDNMKEDFILHLENFSIESLKSYSDCINLFKYFFYKYWFCLLLMCLSLPLPLSITDIISQPMKLAVSVVSEIALSIIKLIDF